MSESVSDDDLPDWVVASVSPKAMPKGRPVIECSDDEEPPNNAVQVHNTPLVPKLKSGEAVIDQKDTNPGTAPFSASRPVGNVPKSHTPRVDFDDTEHGTQEAPETSQPLQKGEITIMLPEKLPATKILMELRASDHNHNTDLAGDAGAVGRIVMGAKDEYFRVDLKGTLYNTAVLPLAGTAMVLNIGTTEAKVESIMHDFVRLQEEVIMGMETLEGDLGDLYAGSDDEVYQVPDEGGGTSEGQALGAGDKSNKKSVASAKKANNKKGTAVSGGVKKVRKPVKKTDKGTKTSSAKKKGGPGGKKKPHDSSTKAKAPAIKPKLSAKKKKAASSEEEESMDESDDDDDDDDFSE